MRLEGGLRVGSLMVGGVEHGAGQYYMDGSLVEDLAGHWDYVGKLVPASARESAV